ncbi:DUF5819 family protein [Streptomyces spinosisporus]|uniref:DUF5819 family protein n=1 Tax=Streptomyces spinosisporus TaxID=2927582 RepID=UPI003558778C
MEPGSPSGPDGRPEPGSPPGTEDLPEPESGGVSGAGVPPKDGGVSEAGTRSESRGGPGAGPIPVSPGVPPQARVGGVYGGGGVPEVGAYAEPRTGVAALSVRYQVGAALALAVVAVAVCVHLGMVFLHVAPSNTVTKAHGKAIDDWVYPEFEQNWKLFAPNPLQQNIAVQARAEVQAKSGEIRTTGWYDLSAEDGRAIDGNLLPSHTQQNELRRALDFFLATHDSDNRPSGLRGSLSENYLRRIVVLRLDREDAAGKGGVVEQVQVRTRTTNVPPPKWSTEKISDKPIYRVLPWWSVATDDTDTDTDGGAE